MKSVPLLFKKTQSDLIALGAGESLSQRVLCGWLAGGGGSGGFPRELHSSLFSMLAGEGRVEKGSQPVHDTVGQCLRS